MADVQGQDDRRRNKTEPKPETGTVQCIDNEIVANIFLDYLLCFGFGTFWNSHINNPTSVKNFDNPISIHRQSRTAGGIFRSQCGPNKGFQQLYIPPR